MNRIFHVRDLGAKRRSVVITPDYLAAACELLKAAMDVSAAQFDNQQPPTANDIALLAMRIADSDVDGLVRLPLTGNRDLFSSTIEVSTTHGMDDEDGSGGDDSYRVAWQHYAATAV